MDRIRGPPGVPTGGIKGHHGQERDGVGDQLNKSTDYAMGDTLERIIPLVDALLTARTAKGGE